MQKQTLDMKLAITCPSFTEHAGVLAAGHDLGFIAGLSNSFKTEEPQYP